MWLRGRAGVAAHTSPSCGPVTSKTLNQPHAGCHPRVTLAVFDFLSTRTSCLPTYWSSCLNDIGVSVYYRCVNMCIYIYINNKYWIHSRAFFGNSCLEICGNILFVHLYLISPNSTESGHFGPWQSYSWSIKCSTHVHMQQGEPSDLLAQGLWLQETIRNLSQFGNRSLISWSIPEPKAVKFKSVLVLEIQVPQIPGQRAPLRDKWAKTKLPGAGPRGSLSR